MTQKELAEKIGILPTYLNSILKGRRNPSPRLAEKLEKATGISRGIWVFGIAEDKERMVKNFLNDH